MASQLQRRSIDDEAFLPPEDFETLAWRDTVRERALARADFVPTPPSRAIGWALLLAILLHLALLIGLRQAMRPEPTSTEENIRVELIDLASPEPALPQPPPIPVRQPSARVAQTPVLKPVVQAPAKTSQPQAEQESIHIYNLDGNVDIPKDLAQQIDDAKPKPSFISPTIAPSPILNPKRPLRVRPNYFAKYWVDSEGLAGLVNQLTTTKAFTTPWGTKVECQTIAFIIGGCGWYTPSPYYVPVERWKPATELDEK